MDVKMFWLICDILFVDLMKFWWSVFLFLNVWARYNNCEITRICLCVISCFSWLKFIEYFAQTFKTNKFESEKEITFSWKKNQTLLWIWIFINVLNRTSSSKSKFCYRNFLRFLLKQNSFVLCWEFIISLSILILIFLIRRIPEIRRTVCNVSKEIFKFFFGVKVKYWGEILVISK